ncbi:major facilitator superfamily protein [Sarocladium implicatum]|nr:major facilitator superfamily protein [Sarocladium implicatum]
MSSTNLQESVTTKADNDQVQTTTPPDAEKQPGLSDAPDGGLRAWLVAAGAGCAFFCTLGFTNTFGVFQAYYLFDMLENHSADQISWIGSLQAFLIFSSGAIGGPLFDRYGALIIRPAAVMYVFSIMMTSISTKYWHFILAQGILGGLGMGLLSFPCMSAIPQYFNKKRGAAMGLAVGGSSIGGIVFPIMLSNLLQKTDLGFGWSVRVMGFTMVPFLLVTVLTVKSRMPRRNTQFFLPESFKKPIYVALIIATFFLMIGMFVPIFLMPTYAITKGMNESLANYLVAILNGASFFGRVIPGILGDKLGRLNALATAGVVTGILVFCWPQAETNASIIVMSVLIGFSSGAIISGSSVAFTLCPDNPSDFGTYIGVGIAMASGSALLGPPVCGALLDRYGGFHQISWFAGTTTLFGAIVCLVSKSSTKVGLFGRT